jgi:DNA polymerase-3 subunit epsilon
MERPHKASNARGTKRYAIVDIETTGGSPNQDRVTEIAIALHNGERIIDQFSTLINPERSIPWNITQLTGITNEMVANAPKFYEVAKDIVEMTAGAVFVAHNVRFDYGFLREEFQRLGYTYSRRQLCTVRLSRSAFPSLGRYNLDTLIRFLGIRVENRHRAMDDVLATVALFERIIAEDGGQHSVQQLVNHGIKESLLPQGITLELLHGLPEACGVYYLHNEQGEVVYVGKSINIKKRVMEHFADQTRKGAKIQQQVADVTYEITGSELAALLLESHEIKQLQPPINRAQRAVSYPFVIHTYRNQANYICLEIARVTAKTMDTLNVAATFTKMASAKGHLEQLVREHQLCQRLCGLDSRPSGPCFYHQIGQCLGACAGEESPSAYNARTEAAIGHFGKALTGSFLLIEEGRHQGELAVVWVENGTYKGFGYMDADAPANASTALDCVQRYEHNKDTLGIIRNYMFSKKTRIVHL